MTGLQTKYKGMKDEDLVQLVKEGNMNVFEVLYKRHYMRVYNLINNRIGIADEARDITQVAFTRAFTRLQGLQVNSRFVSWLMTIAYNEMRVRYRSDKSRLQRYEGFKYTQELREVPTPEDKLHSKDILTCIQNVFNGFIDMRKDLLYDHFLHNLSTADLSAKYDKKKTATKSMIFRCRESIKPKLEHLR